MRSFNHFVQIILIVVCIFFWSCSNDSLQTGTPIKSDFTLTTRSVITPEFDWENIDWMPTPPNQSRIPSPWVGQGSLTSLYGLEVVNDRKKAEGWELLYATFDAMAPGELINPYFILYNKYRGTMRIFLYLTTEFVTTSTYLQDGLSVISSHPTSMLNFLGKDMVDASQTSMRYQQIQPAPGDGTAPMASNKWYMMEYTIAYDPNIAQIPYNTIQLNWFLNYIDVETVSMQGTQVGTLNGLIGQAISQEDNIINNLKMLGVASGKMLLNGIGSSIIHNNTIDAATGENKLGLGKDIFKSLLKDINNVFQNGVSGLPKAGLSLLKAIFGGTTGPTPISFSLQAKIEMTGSKTSAGSLPSTPISFWIPGTNITLDAVGYIPLYNKVLGVINFKGKPDYNIEFTVDSREEADDPFDPDRTIVVNYWTAHCPHNVDYSNHLIINPEVSRVADVTIERQEIVAVDYFYGRDKYGVVEVNPTCYYAVTGSTVGNCDFPNLDFGVRFTIKVAPYDGTPASYIVQTFQLNDNLW